MITISKEPLYDATAEVEGWSPQELSESFDLEAYCTANTSRHDQLTAHLDYPDHIYTSHDGDDTTQIIITEGNENS